MVGHKSLRASVLRSVEHVLEHEIREHVIAHSPGIVNRLSAISITSASPRLAFLGVINQLQSAMGLAGRYLWVGLNFRKECFEINITLITAIKPKF